MIILKKAADLETYLADIRAKSLPIGFVPTMGALHSGHLSLVEASLQHNAFTLCSIFVNPTQFNNKSDLANYPRTIEKDIALLEGAGCPALFLPDTEEIYPPGYQTKHYDLGALEHVMEGKYRPGHFQGVCAVVDRLLSITRPDILFLGQKDYQQCMVIKKITDRLYPDTRIEICPTIREPGGLAMSSRNARLSDEEKQKALALYNALSFMKTNLKPGPLENLKKQAVQQLEKYGLGVDYVQIVDDSNFSIIDTWDGAVKISGLIAATVGAVRLIDNMSLY